MDTLNTQQLEVGSRFINFRAALAAGVAIVAGANVLNPAVADAAPADPAQAYSAPDAASRFNTVCPPDPEPVPDTATTVVARNDCVRAYKNISKKAKANPFSPDIALNDTSLDAYGTDMIISGVDTAAIPTLPGSDTPEATVTSTDGAVPVVVLNPGASEDFQFTYTLRSTLDPNASDTASVWVRLADVKPVRIRKVLNEHHKQDGSWFAKNLSPDDDMSFYVGGKLYRLKPHQRRNFQAHDNKTKYAAYLGNLYQAFDGAGTVKFSDEALER